MVGSYKLGHTQAALQFRLGYNSANSVKRKAVEFCEFDFVVAERNGVGMTHISSLEIRKEELMSSQQLKGEEL